MVDQNVGVGTDLGRGRDHAPSDGGPGQEHEAEQEIQAQHELRQDDDAVSGHAQLQGPIH